MHLLKRPVADAIYKMKLEKTRAWKNTQLAAIPHPVSSIIYTDEDVTIGKDLTNFISMVRRLEKAKHTVGLFKDTGTSRGELHTGVVVVFPGEATERCLQGWATGLTLHAEEEVRIHEAIQVYWAAHPKVKAEWDRAEAK